MDVGGEADDTVVEWGHHHKEDITCLAYLPPSTVATGSHDGYVLLWSLETGQVLTRCNANVGQKPLTTVDGDPIHSAKLPTQTSEDSVLIIKPESRKVPKDGRGEGWYHQKTSKEPLPKEKKNEKMVICTQRKSSLKTWLSYNTRRASIAEKIPDQVRRLSVIAPPEVTPGLGFRRKAKTDFEANIMEAGEVDENKNYLDAFVPSSQSRRHSLNLPSSSNLAHHTSSAFMKGSHLSANVVGKAGPSIASMQKKESTAIMHDGKPSRGNIPNVTFNNNTVAGNKKAKTRLSTRFDMSDLNKNNNNSNRLSANTNNNNSNRLSANARDNRSRLSANATDNRSRLSANTTDNRSRHSASASYNRSRLSANTTDNRSRHSANATNSRYRFSTSPTNNYGFKSKKRTKSRGTCQLTTSSEIELGISSSTQTFKTEVGRNISVMKSRSCQSLSETPVNTETNQRAQSSMHWTTALLSATSDQACDDEIAQIFEGDSNTPRKCHTATLESPKEEDDIEDLRDFCPPTPYKHNVIWTNSDDEEGEELRDYEEEDDDEEVKEYKEEEDGIELKDYEEKDEEGEGEDEDEDKEGNANANNVEGDPGNVNQNNEVNYEVEMNVMTVGAGGKRKWMKKATKTTEER